MMVESRSKGSTDDFITGVKSIEHRADKCLEHFALPLDLTATRTLAPVNPSTDIGTQADL